MTVHHELFQVTHVAQTHVRTEVFAQRWEQMIMSVTAHAQDTLGKIAQHVSMNGTRLGGSKN